MSCYYPLKGYKRSDGGITFNRKDSKSGVHMSVPCGQCIGCRLKHSREWAIRMIHELKSWDQAWFVTLTYNNENLPKNGCLSKPILNAEGKQIKQSHFQGFMKNLRSANPGKTLRYYHCGEYGKICQNCGKSWVLHQKSHKNYCGCTNWLETLGRPHYHAIIYNLELDDLKVKGKTKAGHLIYTSKKLERIWQKGFVTIGKVTFESCAYVSRYITKKINGQSKDEHYTRPEIVDIDTGEISALTKLEPEYATMSRRPAIGRYWLEQYAMTDVYPHDKVKLTRRNEKTKLCQPPRYYDKYLQEHHPEMYDDIKKKRKEEAFKQKDDNTPERLAVKEYLKNIQMKKLIRDYEDFHDE